MLSWMGMYILGKTGQQGKAVELLFVLERTRIYKHHLEMNDEGVESSWVRIKGQDNIGDIITNVCYQPPHQEVEADETF